MKNVAQVVLGLAIGLAMSSNQAAFAQGRNEISGTVFGETGRPVADINIELVTDLGTSLTRIRTDPSGRFTFHGLTNGSYSVRILPYGTDYKEQTQTVVLGTVSASASDRQQLQIYLSLDERARQGPFELVPGVIFAQEVPRGAERLYLEGLRHFTEKRQNEGFDSLKKSIEAFPTYFVALNRLGAEYAIRGFSTSDRSYLEAGIVLLAKASEVNPKSASSVFGLGWAQYSLGMTDQAVESFRRATTLAGNKAADTYLWLGKALKRASTLDQAEAAFKRANELTNGKSAEVHWQTARLYHGQKRYKEAADAFELFLKAQPKSADAEKIRDLIVQLREKAAKQS